LPQRISQHLAEAAKHRQALERAMQLGAVSAESWAPTLPPSAIDVLHYDLDVNLDLYRKVLGGTVRVELAAVEDNLSNVELDADQGLRVLGVTLVHDAALPHDPKRSVRAPERPPVHRLPRSLAAGGRSPADLYGGHASRDGLIGLDGVSWDYHASGQPVVSTFAEPFGARAWWPCNDRPDDKAWSLSRPPPPPHSRAQRPDGGRVENADGTATTRSRYPVSTTSW
jgi:aminopeptidase N